MQLCPRSKFYKFVFKKMSALLLDRAITPGLCITRMHTVVLPIPLDHCIFLVFSSNLIRHAVSTEFSLSGLSPLARHCCFD
jgi:hypothetical protein